MGNHFPGHFITNFITEEEAASIVEKVLPLTWDAWGDENWDNSLIDGHTIKSQDHDFAKRLWDLKEEIKEEMKNFFRLDKELYTEGLYISKRDNKDWPITMHRDSNNNEHHSHGAVLYLNGNFDGGQLYYPDYGVTLEPRPGTLIFHTADVLHGVINQNPGMRYTMNIFWHHDPSKDNVYF